VSKARGEAAGAVAVEAPHGAHRRFLQPRHPSQRRCDPARGRASIEGRRLHEEETQHRDAFRAQQVGEVPRHEAAIAIAAEDHGRAGRDAQHFVDILRGERFDGGAGGRLALRMQQVDRLVGRQERGELMRIEAACLEVAVAKEKRDLRAAIRAVHPAAVAILQHAGHAADGARALPHVAAIEAGPGPGSDEAAALLRHALLQHRGDAADRELGELRFRIGTPGERLELEQHLRGEKRIAAGIEEALVGADVVSQQQAPPDVAHLELEQVVSRAEPGKLARLDGDRAALFGRDVCAYLRHDESSLRRIEGNRCAEDERHEKRRLDARLVERRDACGASILAQLERAVRPGGEDAQVALRQWHEARALAQEQRQIGASGRSHRDPLARRGEALEPQRAVGVRSRERLDPRRVDQLGERLRREVRIDRHDADVAGQRNEQPCAGTTLRQEGGDAVLAPQPGVGELLACLRDPRRQLAVGENCLIDERRPVRRAAGDPCDGSADSVRRLQACIHRASSARTADHLRCRTSGEKFCAT
jgi:hypothetical protein